MDPDMPPPPNQFGGMQPHMMPHGPPGINWGGHHHGHMQPFGGHGHQLSDNVGDEPAEPKDKEVIASLINDRVANTSVVDNTKPKPREFVRQIKSLVDMCLERISQDITPYQARLKLLHPDLIHRLIELMVKSQRLTRKKIDQMMYGGAKIVELDLNYQYAVVNNDFLKNCMKFMTHIRKVSLVNCHNVTDDGTEAFKNMVNLVSLNLTDNRVSDIRLTELRELSLRNTNVTDNGVILLNTLVNLESLDLSKCKIGDASIQYLASFTKLTTLFLNETNVTENGIKALTSLPLSHLSLSNCKKIGNPAFFFITCVIRLSMLSLSTLGLMSTKIVGICFADLAAMTTLTSLNVSMNDIEDKEITPLLRLPNLAFIDLSGTKASATCLQFSINTVVRRPVVPKPVVAQHHHHFGGQDDDEEDDGDEGW
eukprot:gene8367-9832_t